MGVRHTLTTANTTLVKKLYTCISNIGNTPTTKKRQTITGERQKASTAHSSITTTLMD
jgi:hypothetical protein